jgi:hypothetical protein
MSKETTAVAVAPRAKLAVIPQDLRESLAAESLAIANRIGQPARDFIGVDRNKVFRLPGIDKTAPEISVVIVDFVALQQYYPGKFDPKNIQPPVCMALGVEQATMRPDPSSPELQDGGKGCKVCPKNQWKSDGGRGKACKEQRLLAVISPEAPDGALMLLKVSPTAVAHFDTHVIKVKSFNPEIPHPIAVETLVSFEPSVEYATLRFKIIGAYNNIEAAALRRTEARALLLTPPDLGPKDTKKAD